MQKSEDDKISTEVTPNRSSPSFLTRITAFFSILLGGLLGGLTGYAIGDLLGSSTTWGSIGMIFGAVAGSVGVGIITVLTIQAMIEWKPSSKS